MAETFLRSRPLGPFPGKVFSHSWLLVCPKCGEPWARIVVEGADHWNVLVRECDRHPHKGASHHPAGSILYSLNWAGTTEKLLLSYASSALLSHEFNNLLRGA